MLAEPVAPVLVADAGKTSIKVEYRVPGQAAVRVEAAAQGIVDERAGTGHLVAGLAELLARLPPAARGVDAACVGIAGYLSNPQLQIGLDAELRALLPARRLELTSDLVLAHAGAFAGGAGTVLVIGTGAVALGISADGEARVADGLGPLLGDEGGGAWLGRMGLTAALRGVQGRAAATSLGAAAERCFGLDLAEIPGWLSGRGHPTRDLAGFAPAVLAEWWAGDEVSAAIGELAVRRLAATAAAAVIDAGGAPPVALCGSVTLDTAFRERLAAAIVLAVPGASIQRPAGTPLDGAAWLCTTSPERLAASALGSLARLPTAG